MADESFNDPFSQIVDQGNPLEGFTLTPKDIQSIGKLSGADLAKNAEMLLKQKEILLEQKALIESQEKALLQQTVQLEELKQTVAVSELTGLLKLRSKLAQSQIEHDLSEAGRHNEEVWYGVLDVDFLKVLNDRYGYSKADEMLRRLAGSLTEGLRKYDSCFHYGVDEFVVLLIGATEDKIPEILKRITDNFQEKLDEAVEEGKIPRELADRSTFSGGFTKAKVVKVYEDRGVEYESSQNLFDRAAEVLHTAKKGGRNMLNIDGMLSKVRQVEGNKLDLENSKSDYGERYDF